ncbi:hypothetical protein [Salibacterium aidingense]|uniref:hypothetical protein n=1 Tax=Salibacterium aidingense TaxID=384933 RepID=UPI003BD16E30
MMIQSAIYFRGKKVPVELWEARKEQLMRLYEENEQKLKEMGGEEYGTETAGADKGA